ncbi:hypothetical protein BGX33_002229 [Mortierella sp. NVP41]|nr:hypothetical protein BGX33_002229 [Mortierella sp. NVP41]
METLESRHVQNMPDNNAIMTIATPEAVVETLVVAINRGVQYEEVVVGNFPGIVYHDREWSNWAKNQNCTPLKTFHPKNIEELTNIVHQARLNGKKIRCTGSGHSWSSSSVVTDGYLVAMNKMRKVYNPVYSDALGSWTVTVETGVTVKALDDALRTHEPPLALPSNVVLDSVRYGGILSLGCHGAATKTGTLPDLVSEVTIIDAEGNLNTFSKARDPEEFSAATINLGLFGIIYTYTLRVEPMFNLVMTDTFPLLSEYFLDGQKLRDMVMADDQDQTEIFYWPFNTPGLNKANDHIWVKQWQRNNTRPLSVGTFCEATHRVIQSFQTYFGDFLYKAVAAFPSTAPFCNYLIYKLIVHTDREQVLEAPDAIHYQAGIGNIPCLDMEMAFKVNDDFSNVVEAWNYVIDQLYEYANRGEYPFNLIMEMRFVKSSTMLMSPAYDTDPDAIYCMMEILSVKNTPGFDKFSANVAKYWMDKFQARPHWAKMWEHVDGIKDYLHEQNRGRYALFDAIRRSPGCALFEHANRGEFLFNLTLEMRFVKSSTMFISAAYDTV